ASVEQRSEIGHWEIDTVMGTGSKDCIVTLVERKTGYTLIGKLPDRSKHELTARAAWLIHKHTDRFQCKQAFQVRAPLRVMRESDFPFPVLSAPTTSPFFAGFARWLPSGTHRGHRPDHAIAIAVAAGCASGARTASRPSCAAAEIARSPGSWQFVWPQRVPPR